MGDKIVMIGNTTIDPYTNEQLKILKELKIDIHETIMCDDEKYKNTEICEKIPCFPAFCNINSSKCATGFHKTTENFDELKTKIQ